MAIQKLPKNAEKGHATGADRWTDGPTERQTDRVVLTGFLEIHQFESSDASLSSISSRKNDLNIYFRQLEIKIFDVEF